MSAELSLSAANAILDGTATIPATLYLKAHVGNPGNAGANNAATETTRKSFTRNAAAAGATSNPAALTWTGAAAGGGGDTWTHWSAWDAASGGACWIVGTFASSVTVNNGDTVAIAIGDLDLSVTVWT